MVVGLVSGRWRCCQVRNPRVQSDILCPTHPKPVDSLELLLQVSRVLLGRPLLVALVSVGCFSKLIRDGERCFQVAPDAISCG